MTLPIVATVPVSSTVKPTASSTGAAVDATLRTPVRVTARTSVPVAAVHRGQVRARTSGTIATGASSAAAVSSSIAAPGPAVDRASTGSTGSVAFSVPPAAVPSRPSTQRAAVIARRSTAASRSASRAGTRLERLGRTPHPGQRDHDAQRERRGPHQRLRGDREDAGFQPGVDQRAGEQRRGERAKRHPGLLLLGPVYVDDEPLSLTLTLAAAGIPVAIVMAYPVTAWAGARAAMARAILAPRSSDVDSRLIEVTRSRARLVDAFEVERRRIERDLHDGAQQRLVALSMRARRPPVRRRASRRAARGGPGRAALAKQALTELRELIRGVHAKILADRGLAAAVGEVAGVSPPRSTCTCGCPAGCRPRWG